MHDAECPVIAWHGTCFIRLHRTEERATTLRNEKNLVRRYFMILRLQETDYSRNPWRELDRLSRAAERLFEGAWVENPFTYPALNIWTNAEGAVISAELPGMNAEDIEITVTGDHLTLKGIKKVENPTGNDTVYHRRERKGGAFERTVRLDREVDRDKVTAAFKNGVLTITAPWHEVEKTIKITVN